MKPKNDLEHKMLALAGKLPPVTDKQSQYAYDNCFEPLAVYDMRKREVRCLCCGGTMVFPRPYIEACIDVKEYDCPYCDRSMPLKDARACEYIDRKFFTVMTTFRGYQVARTFDVSRANNRHEHFARYSIDEVYQNWLLDDGTEIITGRQLHRSVHYLSWDFHKPMDIRHHNASCTGSYAFDDVYDICDHLLYPDIRVTPLIRRNGFTKKLIDYASRISMIEAMRWLLTVPVAEMLVKIGQFELFLDMVRRERKSLPYIHAVRIAHRHGYFVEDAQMWLDMLSMADRLGLDTHNPQYVCPDDLKAAHDRILKRYTARLRKLDAEKRRKQALEWENKYRAQKAPYLGISFSNDNLIISVLQSVADIRDEGKAMHHCVFEAEYFKDPDSLILSARDKEGNRIETIELSLKTFQVLQSRGVCNKLTEHHDEIIALVNQNINLFKQIKSKVA